MILAFQQVLEPASVVLFEGEQKVAEQTWSYQENRDLLGQIHDLLATAKVQPSALKGVFVLNGPGNFTPVRISCLLANTLAKELDIPLFSLRSDEVSGSDLVEIFHTQKPAQVDFVEAYFGKEPSIS